MNYEDTLVCFFEKYLERAKEKYEWKIPEIEGFSYPDIEGSSCPDKTSFKANVKLKEFLSREWRKASEDQNEERKRQRFNNLAEVIIKDWGKAIRINEETLEEHSVEAQKEAPCTPFGGISSRSKILSIVDMEKYAIYDSRVAAALNAIQYLAGVKGSDGKAFNYPSGRNKIIAAFAAKESPFKEECLQARGWGKIKQYQTYQEYLRLLKKCQGKLSDPPLYELEMTLFAYAEDLCKCAAEKEGLSLP